MAVNSAKSDRGLRWFNTATGDNWLAVLCFVWLALQMPLWWLPPHGDALGHVFPQAWMLFQQPWNFQAIAGMPAAEHPPFLSWITMVGWKIFGVNLLWPHIVSSLLAILVVVGTYKLGLELLDRSHALAAAICMATNWVFFAQASNPYIEIPVAAGLVWALRSLIRKNYVALSFWVAFMTLSKETSFPLLVPMLAFAIWGSARGGKEYSRQWRLAASILLGAIPALAWIAFAWAESGSIFVHSIGAATTNGAIPQSPFELARKLALGPVQLGVMGLWVPLVAIFCLAACMGPRRYLDRLFDLPIPKSLMWLLSGIVLLSIVVHALVSIGLNRYYLPILPVLWVMAWRFLPFSNSLARRTVISLSILWSLFCYFHGVRYADTQDWFDAVRYVSAHRQIGRTLDRIGASGLILTSYPSTVELRLPFAGYVVRPYEAVEVASATDRDLNNVRWAVVGVGGMHYDMVLTRLSGRKISIVDRQTHGNGEVVLYRAE